MMTSFDCSGFYNDLERAEDLFDKFEYKSCIEVCDKLLQNISRTSDEADVQEAVVRIYQLVIAALLETHKVDLAKQRLEELLVFSFLPVDVRVESFFSLAQINSDTSPSESANLYRKGIELLCSKDLKINQDRFLELISSAWCSLADLYLTDLCEVNHAETLCEEAVDKAMSHITFMTTEMLNYNTSLKSVWIDVHRAAAELSLVKQNLEQAVEYARKMCSQIFHHLDKTENVDNIIDTEQQENQVGVYIPSYEMGLSIAKILIECEMHEEAIVLLEKLLEKDDEVLEVWYLLSFVLKLAKDYSSAFDAANCGINLAKKLSETQNGLSETDMEFLDALNKILSDK